uniref:TnpV protein n=1 Tax=Fusobacterium necrophorum TaxID=859 RepID=UPI00373AEB8D
MSKEIREEDIVDFDQALEEYKKDQTEETRMRMLGEMAEEMENSVGYWGRMRMKYLEDTNQELYEELLLSWGGMYEHLEEIKKQIETFYEIEKPKMMKVWGLTESLKQQNPAEYKALENNLASSMREIVIRQFIEQ